MVTANMLVTTDTYTRIDACLRPAGPSWRKKTAQPACGRHGRFRWV